MRIGEYARHVAGMVDSYIYSFVKGRPAELYEASLHLVKAGGKRLRPTIAALTCRLVGGCEDTVIPAASALELIHVFTLIHDDIMDRDDMRRGVPTVHVVWGEPMAITAGDLLFAKALESAAGLAERGVDASRVVEVMRRLAKATAIVAEGQALDMLFEKREDVSIEEYMDMIRRKTGALIEASSTIGGLACGASREDVERLSAYGINIGVAFQIQDDILGIYGSEERLGKPVYSDLREGKKTLLTIYALKHLDEDKAQHVRRVLGRRDASRSEYEAAAELIRESGALDYARRLAKSLVEEALSSLRGINVRDEEAFKLLEELALFVVEREH